MIRLLPERLWWRIVARVSKARAARYRRAADALQRRADRFFALLRGERPPTP